MTSEYRPRDMHASRAEVNSPNIQVLTMQPSYGNNQNVLPLIETSEFMLVTDKCAFPVAYNDLLVQINPISSAIFDLFK